MKQLNRVARYFEVNPDGPTFTTKAEYLVWRTEWRRAYRLLSKQLRNMKPHPHLPALYLGSLYYIRSLWMRRDAWTMLEDRAKSKRMAQQQFEAARFQTT